MIVPPIGAARAGGLKLSFYRKLRPDGTVESED